MSGGTHEDHKVRDRFVAFAFAAADAVMEVTDDGNIGYAAGAIETLTRRTADKLQGMVFLSIIALPDRGRVKTMLADLGPAGRMSPALVHLASGREVLFGACRLPDNPGTFVSLTQPVVRPGAIAARERDRASGALTEAGFATALSERMAEGADGDQLALLDLGDLDKLMATTDPEHRRQLLQTIGEILDQTAGADGVAGRLGGGRFGVLAPKPIDEQKLAKDLTDATAKAAPRGPPLTAKAVTIALETAGLSRADAGRAVLYAVQRFAQAELSVDGISALGPGLPALLADAAVAVAKLRETIRERRVEMALQPIVQLESLQVHHYEALCRLPDNSDPGPVIAAAEQAALAPEFDLMVAEETFAQLGRPPVRREVRVAINLSGRSIESPDFVDALEELLYKHKINPPDILFEITETASIGSLGRATQQVDRLRRRGHPICIDDLGAGAASFQYLSAFNVDFAKIDGRYIRNAATQPRDKAFLVAMIGLCRSLGIPVIAESIETADQAKASQSLGASLGQGYLLGKPTPIRDILDA